MRLPFRRRPAPDPAAAIERREAALLQWTVKALGTELVERHYAAGRAGHAAPLPEAPVRIGLGSRTCRQSDIEHPWLRHWCRAIGTVPFYHRKLWEDAFVLQALWEAGMLAPGRRALGFAVGREPLPAVLASRGVEVLATDLPAGDERARVWVETDQHGVGLDALHRPHLQPRPEFEAMCRFRAVDMAAIPAELRRGGFDMLWSACALEHLGTLEAGMDFVVAAMECLRPGGVAVHTTEYNLDPAGETLERGPAVLYQRPHLEALAARLAAAGHRMLPLDEAEATGALDRYVDLPPYDDTRAGLGRVQPPHLRLSVGGFAATSAGIVVIAGHCAP